MEKSYLYIGHIIYGRNNIYEESLLNWLKKKDADVEILSVNKAKIKDADERNTGIKVLHAFRKPIIDEIARFLEILFLGIKWCMKSKNKEKAIIMLSAPVEVNYAVKILSRIFSVKSVNLIIDTAMGNILGKTFWERYICRCYRKAESLCKYMSASMALNKNVFDYLDLEDKPCLHTRIGHNLKEPSYEYKNSRKDTKIIVYTGTLIYYDGTRELLEAMSMLNSNEYVLHIYGSGPEEALAREYQDKYPNIKYMGRLPNREMKAVMENADLLVNPRIDNKYTDIFGFPSKMIEYLMSGTPVLTTEFAAMPEEYKDFVYVVDEQTGKGIAEAIKRVFEEEEMEREKKCRKAYEYIYCNNKYEDIVEEMLKFIGSI